MTGFNIKTKRASFALVALLLISAMLCGCQGRPSEEPPIHINPNMDQQPKNRPQSESRFFEDGATMRMPVEGTVAQGRMKNDPLYQQGKDPRTGEFIEKSPIEYTMEGLERGRERYNIYCSICHGQLGDGTGTIISRGYIVPPNFHTDQIREYPDGQIYDIITNGIRNMPKYSDQIIEEDRWLIVNYIRALQLSQNAEFSDLPEEIKEKLK